MVCLLGGNASGKSTTLKTILDIVRLRTELLMVEQNVTMALSIATAGISCPPAKSCSKDRRRSYCRART